MKLRWMSPFLGCCLLLLVAAGASSAYEAPDDCDVDGGGADGGGYHLTCHLSAINSHAERTNFTVIPSRGTAGLTVKCSDGLTESSLEPGAFRSLSSLRSLTLAGCNINRIPRDAFRGLSELRELTVRSSVDGGLVAAGGADIALSSLPTVVEEGAFSGLESLEVLDLSESRLRSLPVRDGICGLRRLRMLRLSGNRISSVRDLIDDDSEECLPELQELVLSRNEITSLEEGDLPASAASQLQVLRLDSNFVGLAASLPGGGAPALRVLDLSANQIEELPADFLAGASDLAVLSLANNSLRVLDSDVFSGLRSLEVLDLSGNALASSTLVGQNIFSDLSALLELNLGSNELDTLAPEGEDESELFSSTLSLEALRLDNNGIRGALPASLLAPLTRLRTLDFSDNEIDSVAGSLDLPALTHLHLSGNRLRGLSERALANATSVLVLDLSRNQLDEVPAALGALRVLQTLDLSHNQIASLEGASILRAEHLWRLQLAHNSLRNLTRGLLGGLGALQVLDASSNQISRVERGAFDSNPLLQAIRLDGNRLTGMVGLFQDLPALNWLNVSDNAIADFDYSLLPRELHWLDLSHNQVRELGNYHDLAGQLALEVLDASFNGIEILGPNSVPDKVETLLLNDNKISQIVPYTFFKKTRLRKVDLSVNELKTVDRNALRLSSEVSRLPDFYLGGNPVECDCHMVWFKSINSGSASSLQNYPIIRDVESIYCRLVYTREASFVPLVEARNEQFLCPYETHCFALCKCCDFDACDCEMTCPDNCTCYHDNSWSKNIAVCSSQDFRDLPEQLPMDATEIFLDGNNLTELDSHTFIGRKNLRVLHLNNSGISEIQNKTFNGLRSLSVLHLEDNQISRLDGYEFEGLSGLRELYLQGNSISQVAASAFKHLRSLEVLNLQGNRVIDFPVWQLAFNPFLVSVRLADNLWSCDCEYLERFRSWMSVYSAKIFDAESVSCVSNEEGGTDVRVADFDVATCTALTSSSGSTAVATTRVQELVDEDYLPLLAATLASFALVLFLILAAFLYRHTLRVYIHSKYGVRVFDSSFGDDDDNVESGTLESGSNSSNGGSTNSVAHPGQQRLFDAFVSYSPKDDRFVREVLAPGLESGGGGQQQYRLCLHHRDAPPATSADGAQSFVADTVVQAAAASRRTLLVLSENFLRSEWSRYDYKSGLHQALRSGLRRRLVVVVLGDVNSRDLDPDLRLWIKTSVVVQWGDRLFWERLRYALPDAPAVSREQKVNNAVSANAVQYALQQQYQGNLHQAAAAAAANNNKPVGVSAVLSSTLASPQQQQLPASTPEDHYYHQPRYATYLPPPPPSSVTPAPSVNASNIGAYAVSQQRMLPSPPPMTTLPQQQQHLAAPPPPQQHYSPNLPGQQVPTPNRNVVMHI